MKVLITHGYFIHEDVKEGEIMCPYPPLGLLYVSAYLKQQNIDCHVFDSTFESQESWKENVCTLQPDMVLFYTNLMTKINVIKLSNWAKKEIHGIKTVAGGPDVTYNLDKYLNNGFDFCIVGEGEQTAHELVQALSNQLTFSEISGIAYLENGKLIQTTSRKKMKDLSELPLPDRSAIPINKYLDVWKKHHGKATLNISTQRGCPYSCKWCSTAVYGRSYRRRPAEDVADEIVLLKKEYGVEALWFVDDVFTVKHKWVEELHTAFKKRNLTIDFEIISRAERLNDHVLNLLQEMGCFRIWIGAESGSQDVINAMHRAVTVEEVREKIKLTQSYNIEAGTFIMVGYPGETEKDIKQTANHLRLAPPDQFTITEAYPIKGTALYNEIEEIITEEPDWAVSTDREVKFIRPYTDKYYKMAVRYIANAWQSSKSRQEGRYKDYIKFSIKEKLAFLFMQTYKWN